MKKAILTFLASLLIGSCGGSGPKNPSRLMKPSWIESTAGTVRINGEDTKIAYVSNVTGGFITPIDTERRKAVDTDLFDDDITPVAVAGSLGQILVRDSSDADSSFDIFTVSKEARALYMFRAAKNGSDSDEYLEHTPVDIGATLLCTASMPYFYDRDESSNPSVGTITVDDAKGTSENWIVEYNEDKEYYSVTGSRSGIQTKTAVENEEYVSDTGSIGFTIYAGSRKTTNKDTFTFGTLCSKPLLLSGVPEGFIFDSSKIFIAIPEQSKVEVHNGSDYSFLADVPLDELSGKSFEPGNFVSSEGSLYLTNRNGDSIAKIDPETLAVVYPDVGGPSAFISASEFAPGNLFILAQDSALLKLFSIASLDVTSTVALTDIPRSFEAVSDGGEGEKRALVSNYTSEVDLVDLTNKRLVDLEDHSSTESTTTDPLFYDMGPKSGPKLLDVTTYDGKTLSERWVLTYNGIIPYTWSDGATITGDALNDPAQSFDLYKVRAGDILVINPLGGTKEEVAIKTVVDGQNLVLESAPSNQGSGIEYQIRADAAYTVAGSKSGFQTARFEEGVAYNTDGRSLSMNIVPSLNDPTTEGDYFTFLSDDGIDSIVLSKKMLPFNMTRFTRVSDGREYVWIANEGSNNISVIDIPKREESTSID